MAAVSVPIPPPPPRLTGDEKVDVRAIAQWASDFFTATVRGGYFLNIQEESEAGEFDPSSLPDPATATVAQAQQTANEGYALAFGANAKAVEIESKISKWALGTLTVAAAATSATATLTGDNVQPDTNYRVLVTPDSFSGTPGIGAFVLTSISGKSTTGFTINLQAAPGAGNSVTFSYFLVRDI